MRVNQKRFLLGFYVVGGSFVTIFQRYLTFHFDNFTQNFFRFLTGSLSLLLVSFFFFRDDLRKISRDLGQLGKIGLLAILSAFSQFLFVEGLSHTSAVMGGLMWILGFPLTIGLVIMIFPDEKETVKSRNFIIGSFLAIGGTIGLILSKGNLNLTYSLGTLYLLIATIVLSITALMTKKLVITSNPICIASLVTGFMCLIFLFGALFWGCLTKVREVSFFTNTILFVSGAYGLMIGMGLAFVNVKIFGVVIVRLAELSTPVFTGIFAYFFFREILNPLQMVFGAILITGCFFILKRNRNLKIKEKRVSL